MNKLKEYTAIAKTIDHMLLNPAMSERELEEGCEVAIRYDVASICILPYYLPRCVEMLDGASVLATTTVGFPHGGHATTIKLAEARQALRDGAKELDAAVNISKVRSEDWLYVRYELLLLTEAARAGGAKIKVIFENAYLDDDAKIHLCEICAEVGADWVNTSTGYAPGGATMADLELMRKHSPYYVEVKAAGGVDDLDTVLKMRAIGVNRVGTNHTVTILDECRRRLRLEAVSVEDLPMAV